MKTSIVVATTLIILLVAVITAQSPLLVGGRIAAPPSTVSLMMNKLMPKLAADIPKIPMPDVSGKIPVAIIGDINYLISAIHLHSFTVDSTTATFASPDIINGRINNAVISMAANWNYKQASWPYVGDSGTCDGTVNVSGDFSLTISIDPKTKSMKFSMKSFIPHINSMDIHLHGGASWFYNIFMNLFQSVVIGMVQDQLGGQIPAMIENILQLEITNLYTPFSPVGDGELFSDFQFAKIDVTEQFIGFGVPTTVFKPNVTQPPYPAVPKAPLPLFDPKFADQMYQIALDEYYFNSLGWALVKNGKLAGLAITAQDFADQPEFSKYFETNYYMNTIPALANTFPNKQLKIEVGPGADLIGFSIDKSSGVSAIADLILSFSIVDGPKNLFSLKVSIVGSAALKFVDLKNSIFGEFKIVDWKLNVDSSKIGKFDGETIFAQLVQKIDESIFLRIANNFAGKGVGIPTIGGMSLTGCKYEIRDGYLLMAGMMDYVPSSLSNKKKQ